MDLNLNYIEYIRSAMAGMPGGGSCSSHIAVKFS